MTVYHEGMTEQTWEYLNAEQFARAEMEQRRNRRLALYSAALALAFMLAALVTAAHAQRMCPQPAYDLNGTQVFLPCNGLPLGGTSLRYSRSSAVANTPSIGVDGQAANP